MSEDTVWADAESELHQGTDLLEQAIAEALKG